MWSIRAAFAREPPGPKNIDVGGGEARRLDAHALRNLAGHRRGGAAAKNVRKLRGGWIGLDLVHAPHEPGAVESTLGLGAVRRLRSLELAAPDVGVADELDGGRQDLALPRSQQWKLERGRRAVDLLLLPVREREESGRRSTRSPRGLQGRSAAARDRLRRWDGSCAGRGGAPRLRCRSGSADGVPPRPPRPGRTTRRRSCRARGRGERRAAPSSRLPQGRPAPSEAVRSARRRGR